MGKRTSAEKLADDAAKIARRIDMNLAKRLRAPTEAVLVAQPVASRAPIVAAKVMRKRGRPRKNPIAGEAPVVVEKRKPGRPRKAGLDIPKSAAKSLPSKPGPSKGPMRTVQKNPDKLGVQKASEQDQVRLAAHVEFLDSREKVLTSATIKAGALWVYLVCLVGACCC
jgi:hypothetical protein